MPSSRPGELDTPFPLGSTIPNCFLDNEGSVQAACSGAETTLYRMDFEDWEQRRVSNSLSNSLLIIGRSEILSKVGWLV